MSNIIKNPNRDKPRSVEIRKPEYERLGVNPTQFNLGNYARPETMLSIAVANKNLTPKTVSEVDGTTTNEHNKSIKNNHIIDNNEFMSFDPYFDDKDEIETENNSESNNEQPVPQIGDYILMICGNIVMSGSLKIIEEKVKNILYGDDLDFDLSSISQEDIIILKRVDIQVGVFIKD